MANRSYVYAVDTLPTKKKQPKPIRSLSEFGWGVPVAHQLLASGSPRRCQSAIWEEHEIGIAGDFKVGRDRLFRFLEALAGVKGLKKKDAFAEAVAETRAFLEAKKHVGKYILLEAGEIYDLLDGELVDACEAQIREIGKTAERVERAIAGKEPKFMAKLAKSWEAELGLYWADVLYFQFGKA
jgi:hypothetical protein